MRRIAIIPARGGSKRIPGKNIKPFGGVPMIAYSIRALLSSRLFDSVIVSTDDISIAEIAKEYGAEVPFMRSQKASDDFATLTDVLLEVIADLKNQNRTYDEVCCMLATAPFISSDQIIAMNQRMSDKVDAVFTIQAFDFPIFRALKKNDNGYLEMVWPEHVNTRSQDLPQTFHDAGQVYWIRIAALLEYRKLYSPNAVGFELGKLDSVDIDTEEDWKVAEKLFELKNAR